MTAPRIAIDLRYAAAPLSGFGRFTWNLVIGLARLGPPAPLMLIRHPGQAVPPALAAAPGVTWRDVVSRPYAPLRQRRLARQLAEAGVEVMVSPDVFAPFCRRPRQVITLHDVVPLRCPELLPRSAKGRYSRLWRQWLTLQIAAADRVLTVSEHARADIAALFAGARPKLRTVYNAVELQPWSARPAPGPVVRLLYVGRCAPYKNIIGCIEALASLRQSGLPAELAIVGEPDPRYPEVAQAVARLGLDHAVTITGHVDDTKLAAHYRDATLFLFLSRYEGFGLPPLEAMAHGLPVVSSNRTSMPEVLGDAALLVDPDDPPAVVAAIRQIVEQPALAADLSRRGRARAAEFTLERQGRMAWDAIASLLP